MIKHVIFDFDGTIVDSKYLTVGIINGLAEKYNFQKIKKEEQENFRSLSIVERMKAIQLPVYLIPLVAAELNLKYRQSVNSLQLVRGIDKVIGELKGRGLKLSIMSSNSINNINALFNKEGITAFDDIYTSKNIFGKDIGINIFLNRKKLKNDEVIYIGDECRDIVACQKNKVKVIAVGWGYDSTERLAKEKPDYIVRTPIEITRIINSLM